MFRTLLLILALGVGVWVLLNALITTDLDLVERDVERLVELARSGGQEAADEIYAALAEDYDGTYRRETIESYLRTYVGKKRLTGLGTGDYKTIWKGEEIVVPLLALYPEVDGYKHSIFLTVTYGERADGWKIVDITRWKQ